MKRLKTKLSYALYILLVAVFLQSCQEITGTYVVQKLNKECGGLAKSGTALVTYVWYENEIAEAWYDDITTVNDSLVFARKEQANKLLEALKNCN